MKIDNDTLEALKAEAALGLGIETLDTRNSDSLDFHEVSVWSLVSIIEMAYAAGYQQGGLDSN